MNPAALNSIALHWDAESHQFAEIPLHELTWSALDLGVQYGAILVERIRTFGGKLPDLELHIERLARGLQTLQIDLPFTTDAIPSVLARLLVCNAEWISQQQDVSIVLTISPGNEEWGLANCTCQLHLLPLPWSRLRTWYARGTELFRSNLLSGAGQCWPSDIKVRSRLNYFLADRADAKTKNALSLLVTTRGCVADTSVANLLLVTDEGDWVSPKRDDIVVGTSLLLADRLLRQHGIAIEYRDVAWAELARASELILVGNSGCVWHARSMDGQRISSGQSGDGCRMLQRLWIERLGFDWLSQVDEVASS